MACKLSGYSFVKIKKYHYVKKLRRVSFSTPSKEIEKNENKANGSSACLSDLQVSKQSHTKGIVEKFLSK